MSKPRKPDSRRPSQKKLKKRQKNMSLEEIIDGFYETVCCTYPAQNSKKAIEECKQRVKEGKICYCKKRGNCRKCPKYQKDGKCILGCNECSECYYSC